MPVGYKQTYRFGPFELDVQVGELRKGGLRLKLQGQPIQILEILLQRPGQLVTREEIRQRLWTSDTFVDFDHSLNTAIKKLREALGDEAGKPRYIETLPRRGYRFIRDLTTEERQQKDPDAGSQLSAGAATVIATTLADAAIKADTKPLIRTRRLRRIALLLLAAAGMAAFVYWICRPLPVPHVVGTRVLTRTGNPKDFLAKPLNDRRAIYFFEKRPAGWVTLQVPFSGGDVSEFHSVGWLSDISSDGLKLLSIAGRTEPPGASLDNGPSETWAQILPNTEARLVIKDSESPIWYGEESILFLRTARAELYRTRLDGTGLEKLADVPRMLGPHLSPDQRRIRFISGPPSIGLWDLNVGGHELRPAVGGRRLVMGGSWTPDGNWYFFTHWDGEQWSIWAAPEHQHWWKKKPALQQVTLGPLSIGIPAVGSDGRQLFAAGRQSRGRLSVYDSERKAFVPYLSGISACYTDFTRDGKWITYVSYPEGTLWRSRIDGSDRRQLTIPPMAVVNPRWSPDGRLIAFTDFSNGSRKEIDDGTPRRIYVISADGGSPMLIAAGPANPTDPAWSPDGNSIAYSGGGADNASDAIQILDIRTQRSVAVPGSQGFWSLRWSPDGKHLIALSGFPSNKFMLFTFSTGKWNELAVGSSFNWPSWSRDSTFVYANEGESLVRIAISDHRKELVASLKGIRSTSYLFDRYGGGWYGLTPDDRPITTLDTGIEEIYAFDLEYK